MNIQESTHINFYIGDKEHNVQKDEVSPETTLNTYLRDKLNLVGTKKMCLEGGCGTCVVAVETEDPITNTKSVFAVNSCLVSIFSCHGWKIHTIEGIGSPFTKYHPIQKLLAENNGTQCGYCSPGMVMNMFALNESGPKTMKEIENSFSGNICRCTGYRPILAAFKKLASDSEDRLDSFNEDIEDLKLCPNKNGPCEQECSQKCETRGHFYELKDSRWMKVYFIKDILTILRTNPNKTHMLVAGNTAKGAYRSTSTPDMYIDVTKVAELTTHSLSNNTLILGANMTLNVTMELFNETSKQNPNFSYLSKLADHIDLVANVPVRNIGTLAGNLMTKHQHQDFQSDIFLILETVNAVLVLVDINEMESRVSPENFLDMDMSKRIIKQIILPALDSTYLYTSYKIMPRAQNTPAFVNAGFLMKMKGEIVDSARIVYGAINPDFVHASKTEELLKDKNLFDNNTLKQVYASLEEEIKPNHVLPDPSPGYRKLLAISLFYKFVLSVAPSNKVSKRNQSGGQLLQRPVSSGSQDFGTQENMYPVSEPKMKLEAYAQTSGQATYVADLPNLPGQLHAAFVMAKAESQSVITSIDTKEALSVQGVVAFLDKNDIPGENAYMPKLGGFPTQEELFCSGVVKHYYQPVGIILATDHEIAVKAADLVKVTVTPPKNKPLLNIREILKSGAKNRIKPLTNVVPKSKGKDVKQVINGKFDISWQYHFHMELHSCQVIPTEDSIDIYPASQWIDLNQISAAAVLNIPSNAINVTVRRCGGGFGGKVSRGTIAHTAAALAAYKLRKPVKMWVPFEHTMNIMGKRYPFSVDYEVAVNGDGVIQYLNAELYSDLGAGSNEPIDSMVVDLFENCYNIDTWNFTTNQVNSDTTPGCWTRAPGTTEALGAIESIMEHIATVLNKDPFDVKMANFNKTKSPKLLEFIKNVKNTANIDERKAAIETFNKENRWKKRGLSLVPMRFNLEIYGPYPALVSVFHADGTVAISHAGIEVGQGINTKVVQTCAYKLGLPVDKISVKPTYNMIGCNGNLTAGSLTSEVVCYAIIKACDNLLAAMKPVKDELKNGTWLQIVQECYRRSINLQGLGNYNPNDPGLEQYDIYGVSAAEVEVDILTGQHQILRFDILEDVGQSISPLIDIGQIEGALMMGIGYYTTEQIVYDDRGALYTNRTWTYRPPGAKDIPIDLRVTLPKNSTNPVGILNTKAVAEPPLCLSVAVPLAIRNALASARIDSNVSNAKWYPFNGPSTIENTLLNTLNSYSDYVL